VYSFVWRARICHCIGAVVEAAELEAAGLVDWLARICRCTEAVVGADIAAGVDTDAAVGADTEFSLWVFIYQEGEADFTLNSEVGLY